MPINPTFPGVYVQELPSSVRTIVGVSTSVTAFLGLAKRGPINQATHIFSLNDYNHAFGGLVEDLAMSYAVSQFFLNGGSEAWIVRLALNAQAASLDVNDSGGNPVMTITAVDEGTSGNDILVKTDDNSTDKTISPGTFNLTLIYSPQDDPADSRTEIFKGLSMDPTSPHFVETVINDVSLLVKVKVNKPASGVANPPQLPQSTNGKLTGGQFAESDIAGIHNDDPTKDKNSFLISFDGSTPATPVTIDTKNLGQGLKDQVNTIATRIQKAVRNAKSGLPAWSGFTCTPSFDDPTNPTKGQLILTSGVAAGHGVKVAQAPNNDIAASLKLDTGTSADGSKAPHLGQDSAKAGKGDPFDINDNPDVFFPSDGSRTGIHALDEVDIFNLLCMPGVTDANTINQAIAYCQARRAFVIVDPPATFNTPAQIVNYITGPNLSKGDAGTYAAIYFPWVQAPDPLKNGKLTYYPPSGMMAGLYARTDSTRGVWKAPAGTEANLINVMGLNYPLTDGENGSLNPLGVNCLRIFPIYGAVSWGARTVNGSDAAADQYKYIPVRRTALYIEESLRRGLQWVVFEPNDEPLWAQIRLNVGAFMHNLFVKGAFQGKTPRDAYFVKCDNETTTQNDIDLGIVNIVVGFAPLKPAEFVIISLQQIAGQLQV